MTGNACCIVAVKDASRRTPLSSSRGMVCDLSGAIFDFTVSSRVRLDVSVRIESTQINTVSVRLFAGLAKAVELNLNG